MFVFMKYNECFHFRILIPYLVPAVMAQVECFSQGPKTFHGKNRKKIMDVPNVKSLISDLVPNQYIYRLPLQALEVCGACDA